MARNRIRERILNGELAEGLRLPAETELRQKLGIGRHSLRRAVSALASEGLLSVEQGRGTFVRRNGPHLLPLSQVLFAPVDPESVGFELVSQDDCEAPAHVAEQLELPAGAKVTRLTCICLGPTGPLNLVRVWHVLQHRPEWVDLLARRREHLEAVFDEAAGTRKPVSLQARLPETWEARLLEQNPSLPVQELRLLEFDAGGAPVILSESVWAASRMLFSFPDQPVS